MRFFFYQSGNYLIGSDTFAEQLALLSNSSG